MLPDTGPARRCAHAESTARNGTNQHSTALVAQARPPRRWRGSPAHLARCCCIAAHKPALNSAVQLDNTAARAASVACTAAKGPGSCQLGWSPDFHNHFSLGRVLGQGSYGKVLEAVARASGQPFAVKVLQKARRAHYRDCILREVSNWGLVQGSQNVARLEGLYEDKQHAYIVQELCHGGDVKALVEAHGYLSEHETAHVMMGVLDMLQECHRHSICYGDVKPANFLLAQPWLPTRGRVAATPESCRACTSLSIRAVDFGCSQRLHKGSATRRQSGTPLYSAPEIVFGRHGVPVDIWSAGVMMYQLLTGKLPFWPDKSLAQVAELPAYELLAAVRTFEIHYPRVHWFGLSGEARELVERMLDRNPATRITAEAALQHPWFSHALTHPSSSGSSSGSSSSSSSSSGSSSEEDTIRRQGEKARNNVVGFPSGSITPVADGAACGHLATPA